jgi:DNA recombination protein RmuC
METIVTTIGGRAVSLGEVTILAIVLLAIIFIAVATALLRASRAGRRAETEAADRAREMEGRIGTLIAAQAEMTGRMQSMSDLIGGRQAELNQNLSERLDGLSHRLNQSMGDSAKTTHDNLKRLHERLAVLDSAQKNITDLTGQVTALSNILANKQSRGAFGQGRMEAIIGDNLPVGAFQFQFTMRSGARPDCIIHLPNDAPPLVIDAKFPLEAFNALKSAESPERVRAAQQQFRGDITKHIRDISEKYLVPGETHDTAFMFVPSESVFAEIHENFDDVVQRAYRARVVIVSPSLLLLSIQVIQAVLRDHRLREQAHVIQDEVAKMMQDVERLDDRVRKLAAHFSATQKDIDQILISTDKVTARGRRIDQIGLEREEDRQPMLLAGE